MKEEAIYLLEQIHLLNTQFHESENYDVLKDYRELMRANKNRCQLMLLKFFSPDIVWIRKDFGQINQEWLIGVHGQPEYFASHIPLSVLQKGLSDMQLAAWDIC